MKNSPFNNPVDRRAFLRGGVRYGLLAGLAAMAARVISGASRSGEAQCTSAGVCGGCPDYTGCELPPALSAKQVRAGGGNGGGVYEEISRIPGAKTASRNIEFGPDDLLFLATGNSVIAMNRNSGKVRELALDAPVRCVAVAGDGTVFAGLRNRIESFNAKGERIASWELPGKRTWLTGLAVGENDLFAADAGNRVVLRLNRSGQVVGRIGEKDAARDIPGFIIPSPYFSVKIHPDGLLRVNNPGRHRVEAYTFEGEFSGAWGKASGNIQDFCGCCNPIRLALLPDGRMVTCEKGLPRVKIYSVTGEFESVVAPVAAFPENAKVGAGERDADAALAGLCAAVDSRGRIAILDHVTGEIRILQPKTGGIV